jgi:class 3 adenylate cyclase
MSHNPHYRRFPPSLAPLALLEARRRTGLTNNPGQGRIERTLAAILARPLWLRSGNMAAVWKLIAEPNAGASDRQVLLRAGIDLGDALIDGDDILGDGVNIAARVESMASRPISRSRPTSMGLLRTQAAVKARLSLTLERGRLPP